MLKKRPASSLVNDLSSELSVEGTLELLDEVINCGQESNSSSKKKKKSVPKSGTGVGYLGKELTKSQKTRQEQVSDQAKLAEEQQDSQLIQCYTQLSRLIQSGTLKDGHFKLICNSKSLRQSLVPMLRNDSLLNIGQRHPVYTSLFSLITAIASEPFTASLLFQNLDPTDISCGTVADLLGVLSHKAKIFIDLQQSSSVEPDEAIECALSIALQISDISMTANAGRKFANAMGIHMTYEKTASLNADSASASMATDVAKDKEKKLYIETLRPKRFEAIALCDMIANGETSHALLYSKPTSSSAAPFSNPSATSTSGHAGGSSNPRQRLVRVASEMSDLSSSLPVEFASSIFVRCDDTRMDVIKALIIGPEDTPYSMGCFEFDILLPPDYPHVPPHVKLITTGHGTMRFNPNLYNCGKVCLSLLGTWAGPGWDPKISTILQVLVSIQSLILVSEPYFNEPAYYNLAPNAQSEAYKLNIRVGTLRHAILDQMRSPSPVFADVIRSHFYLKRNELRGLLQSWRNYANSVYITCIYDEIEKLDKVMPKTSALDNSIRDVVEICDDDEVDLHLNMNVSGSETHLISNINSKSIDSKSIPYIISSSDDDYSSDDERKVPIANNSSSMPIADKVTSLNQLKQKNSLDTESSSSLSNSGKNIEIIDIT